MTSSDLVPGGYHITTDLVPGVPNHWEVPNHSDSTTAHCKKMQTFSTKADSTYSLTGYLNWKKGLQQFVKHETLQAHSEAMYKVTSSATVMGGTTSTLWLDILSMHITSLTLCTAVARSA